jgi:hypothetical protein
MAKKTKTEQVPRIRDQKFISVYSNFVGIMTSPVDFQLLFAHLQPTPEGKAIIDQVLVAMTPVQAKLLIRLLATNMKNWEAANGEIKVPEISPA